MGDDPIEKNSRRGIVRLMAAIRFSMNCELIAWWILCLGRGRTLQRNAGHNLYGARSSLKSAVVTSPALTTTRLGAHR